MHLSRDLSSQPRAVQDEEEAELTELLAPRAADVENPLYTSPAASAVARASTAGLKQAPMISCDGITFAYPGSKSRPVLSGLSVRLRPASVHAVVGTLTTAPAISSKPTRSLRCW
jgi:ABC-type multidrug transport system fused ATPase/permease subunit